MMLILFQNPCRVVAAVWETAYANDFTGADETALSTHDSNWTQRNGTLELLNDTVGGALVSGRAELTGVSLANDQRVSVTLTDTAFYGGIENVAVRCSNSGGDLDSYSGYALVFTPTTATLLRKDRSVTQLDDAADLSIGDGDVLQLQAEGTNITAKLNGETILAATDATHSAGSVMIAAFADEAFDDILVEEKS